MKRKFTRAPRPPKKKLRPFCCDNDVQGSRREAIIEEHLRWLESHRTEAEQRRESEKDFSASPIARWYVEHMQNSAQCRTDIIGLPRKTKT